MSIDYESAKLIVDDLTSYLRAKGSDLRHVTWEPQQSGRSLYVSFDLKSELPKHAVRSEMINRLNKSLKEIDYKDWLVTFNQDGVALDVLMSATPHEVWLEHERQIGRL